MAALTAALEAQIKALEVERDALRLRNEERAELARKPSTSAQEVAVPDSGPGDPDQKDDEVSARLVATRLALEGADREKIREKLDSTYDLEDADSLIDDVLERLA